MSSELSLPTAPSLNFISTSHIGQLLEKTGFQEVMCILLICIFMMRVLAPPRVALHGMPWK